MEKEIIDLDEWLEEAKKRFKALPLKMQEAIGRENVEYLRFEKPSTKFIEDDPMLAEIVEFIEKKVAEYDKFVDEVDCGDDWFIVYSTILTAMEKILEYAKEQKRIYDKQTTDFMNQEDFGTK